MIPETTISAIVNATFVNFEIINSRIRSASGTKMKTSKSLANTLCPLKKLPLKNLPPIEFVLVLISVLDCNRKCLCRLFVYGESILVQ